MAAVWTDAVDTKRRARGRVQMTVEVEVTGRWFAVAARGKYSVHVLMETQIILRQG